MVCFSVSSRKAKEKKLRIWKDYKSNAVVLDIAEKTYTGKVVNKTNVIRDVNTPMCVSTVYSVLS